jgi:hypothetical protein
MWFFAEIVSREGIVLSRAEGEVAEDGDLAALVKTATDHFRRGHPDDSLLSDMDQIGHVIRIGKP